MSLQRVIIILGCVLDNRYILILTTITIFITITRCNSHCNVFIGLQVYNYRFYKSTITILIIIM